MSYRDFKGVMRPGQNKRGRGRNHNPNNMGGGQHNNNNNGNGGNNNNNNSGDITITNISPVNPYPDDESEQRIGCGKRGFGLHQHGMDIAVKIHKAYAGERHFFASSRQKSFRYSHGFGRNGTKPVGQLVHYQQGDEKRSNKLTCNINQL